MAESFRMRFYSRLLFTVLTAISALSSASLFCEIAVSNSKLPWLGIPDSALSTTASGKPVVKTDVLLNQYRMQADRVKYLSVQTLFEQFQQLVEIEHSKYGGLTGIAEVKPVALDLIRDLGIPKEKNQTEISRKRYWSNYYRNQLQSALILYPSFFKDNITAPPLPAIPVRLEGAYMAAPTDFRLFTLLIQRELMKRIINQPREALAELGLEYPADDSILKDSLEDLRSIVFL